MFNVLMTQDTRHLFPLVKIPVLTFAAQALGGIGYRDRRVHRVAVRRIAAAMVAIVPNPEPTRRGERVTVTSLWCQGPFAPTVPTTAATPLPSHPTLLAGMHDLEPRSCRRCCDPVEIP
jgi:hypothetical protein